MTELAMPTTYHPAIARVHYLGSYRPDYARHRVIQQGLRDLGVLVDEHCEQGPLLQRWARLSATLAHVPPGCPVIVGEAGNYLTPVLWEARRRRLPLVFDPFISLCDSIEDRASSWRSAALQPPLALLDWFNNLPAQAVLCDTPQMREYFIERLGLRPERAFVVPVGAETELFKPQPRQENQQGRIRVLFYGTFIPLQGIDTIIQAAAEVGRRRCDIAFQLVGSGQTAPEARALAAHMGVTNVQFGPNHLAYQDLPALIAQADMCLGIFANRPKTQRVIPNKLYQCAATGTPVITADTPAVRWGFRPGELMLVPPGDPLALADAIVQLADDRAARQRIGAAGAVAMRQRFGPRTIATHALEACRAAL